MQKIVTWNVNSVGQRLSRLLALLERMAPDVVCLQELKCVDESFPFAESRLLAIMPLSMAKKPSMEWRYLAASQQKTLFADLATVSMTLKRGLSVGDLAI